jgi:outer membrane protein OmpU
MKTKGEIIMNIKKIGLSALAGSLAMVSANAVELAVSGKTEITYVSKSGDASTAGNPFGMGNAITFAGSGDMNGMTATYTAVLQDGGTVGTNNQTFASSSLMLDMGDMGTVGFDQGVGAYGFSTIDDKTPTAYEESWHATSFSSGGLGNTGGSSNVLGYKNSMGGFNLSVEYSPDFNETTDNGDGAVAGAGSLGSNTNFALTTSSLVEGLDVGFGMGKNDDNRVTDGSSQDGSSVGGYANYSMGPLTVGYTSTYSSGSTAASAANAVTAYGIAFNVNENLSISYNEHENEFKKTSTAASGDGTTGQADVTQESTGIAAAYTMGAAALRIQNNDVDNVGGVVGTNEEITEVSLFLSF